MKLQKAKKVAIKYESYRVIYLFMDVPVGARAFTTFSMSSWKVFSEQ